MCMFGFSFHDQAWIEALNGFWIPGSSSNLASRGYSGDIENWLKCITSRHGMLCTCIGLL
jgi:hypothetical protein